MINLFEPRVSENSVDLLQKVFHSNWLGRGSYVTEFQAKLSDFLRVDAGQIHTIASCSDAIFGVFDIYKFQPGDEVIIPSISFPAVGSAILAANLIPKIVDIESDSGNIDFNEVKNALSKKTVAIFLTHYGGIPVDVNKLRELVGENIKIFEDAACALGSYIGEVACGTQGDYGCWSFDAMKMLTCGEGGAIYIKDQEILTRAKEYFYLGLPSQAKSGIDRSAAEGAWWEYQLNCHGRRSIFTNINAAIGLPQFSTLESAYLRRQKIRNYYCENFDKINIKYLRQDINDITYSNYFFTLISERRNQLAIFLKDKGIYSTFRYYPLSKINIFSKYSMRCARSDLFSSTALNIPIHHSLTDFDVEYITDTIKNFIKY